MKNKNNFKIRKAKLEDLDDILVLNHEFHKSEHKLYDRNLDLNWTFTEGKKYFCKIIKKRNNFMEVVEGGGKIIGYICGSILKKSYPGEKFKYAELNEIYIGKKFRNKKIGIKLTNDFQDWCRKNEVNFINVMAYSKSNLVHNFYRKTGFKDFGIKFQMKLK